MKIKISTILDVLFVIFVFSSTCMFSTTIGKIIQLASTILILLLTIFLKPKFTFYNILELLFLIYIFLQFYLDIAVMKNVALQSLNTVLYNLIFILAIINYCIYKKDIKSIIKLYTNTVLISFIILAIFNFQTILSYRFNSRNIINLFNIEIIGGHSSTSLAVIAAIPAFFTILLSDKKELKKNILIAGVLLVFAILTGTRKTLLIFLLTFLVTLPLNNNKISITNMLKILIRLIIIMIPTLFIIFKIPFIYNRIGTRIENVVYSIKNNENIDDASMKDRKRMIIRSEQLYKERPIYGWGMDYFRASKQNNLGYYSHNNFWELLTGGGIVGFVIYYVKYIYLLVITLKIMNKDKEKKTIWFNCFCFIICMTIIEYWQVTYVYRFIIIYQGLLVAMIYNRCREKNINLLT